MVAIDRSGVGLSVTHTDCLENGRRKAECNSGLRLAMTLRRWESVGEDAGLGGRVLAQLSEK